MKAVLFDLDDTLYQETDFVSSGFKKVANYLASKYSLKETQIFNEMWNILLKHGRGKVFNHILRNLHLEEKVELLVYLYRSNYPAEAIRLYDNALSTLNELIGAGMKLGIVTDGLASVQRNKVRSLRLEKLFEVIIYTGELGGKYEKPSPVPFQIALELLEAKATEAVYVGDNPSKDFIGPNSLGMFSIMTDRKRPPGSIPIPEVNHKQSGAKFAVKELKDILPIIYKN